MTEGAVEKTRRAISIYLMYNSINNVPNNPAFLLRASLGCCLGQSHEERSRIDRGRIIACVGFSPV